MLKKLFLILIIISLPVIFFLFSKKETKAQTQTVTLGPWQAKNLPNASHQLPSYARGNYFYILSLADGNIYKTTIVDGQMTDLENAGPHAPRPHGFVIVVADNVPYAFKNGHVLRFNTDANNNVSGVSCLEWASESCEQPPADAFGDIKYMWDSAVYVPFASNKYIFHLGGFNMNGHEYNVDKVHRKTLPLTAPVRFEQVGTAPVNKPYKAAFFKASEQYGFIYMGTLDNVLWRIRVNSDGSLGQWQETGQFPTGENNRGDMFVIDNQLFVIRGSKVSQSTINTADGTISTWRDSPPLPEQQITLTWSANDTEPASYGIIGNYVCVTGSTKVFCAEINRGTQPSTSPNPTATTGPAPTLAPCPTTLAKDSHIIFPFQSDRISNLAIFNAAGGLTVTANNSTQSCKLTVSNIQITGPIGLEYTTATIDLPAGLYTLFISGPRSLKSQFNQIKLTSEQTLTCPNPPQPTDCGDLNNITTRSTRKLLSGDANHDNIVDIIDYELFRQTAGFSATGNNADFDYNGQVEYKNGVNDDFEFLKNNFGKYGNNFNSSTPVQKPTSSSSVPTTTPAIPTQGQGSGTINGIFTIRANGNTYINAMVAIWNWPPTGEYQSSLHDLAILNPPVTQPTNSDMTIIYSISGLTDGQKYIVSPSVIKSGGQAITINPQNYCSDTNGSITDPVLRQSGCPVTVPGFLNFTITL